MATEPPERADGPPNGAALAAFLAAGIGAAAMGVVVALSEVGIFSAPALYAPAGGVTGRTTLAAAIWLAAWAALHRRWRGRELDPAGPCMWTFALVAAGTLLTFPPVWRLFG